MEKNYPNSRSLLLYPIRPIQKRTWMLLLFLFSLGQYVNSQTVTFNTPGAGNWIVPCDVTSITVQAWGGGGAGGAADNNPNGGSGGGGGGYSSYTVTVTPNQTINFTVGAGGNGGNGNGANGTATTILALTANGGTGGGQNQGTAGIGGTATGGSTNITGSNGSTGTTTLGAAGGFSNGLAGGTSRNTYGNGNDATNPGSGGGGGLRNCGGGCSGRTGGDGANGQIVITYTSVLQNYCNPSFTTGVRPISNVTFAGINNTTSNVVGVGPEYIKYCNTATVIQGSATNAISLKGNTNGNNQYFFRVYIDWDQNGTFGNNANEIYNIGSLTNSVGDALATPLTGNIAVPATANLGLTTMRVMFKGAAYSATPCEDGVRGQAEDYLVNVSAAVPTITGLGTTNGCPGNSLTITGTNFIGITAANVQIGGTAVSSITSFTSTQIIAVIGTGTTGTVTVTTASGTATSAATYTVNSLSVAPTNILGTTTICNGDTTTLSLSGGSAGTGATLQWFSGSCGGTLIGTGNSITVSPIANTNYFVRYTGTCNTTLCASTTVIVNQPHSITAQPTATQTVCSDNSVSFSVSTSGAVGGYQWYKGATPLSNGGNISGANSATLTINPVVLSDAASDYYCAVSGTCAPTVNSNNAELVVIEKVSITSQPTTTQTLCTGNTATFSVVATGAGLSYQWYNGATPLSDNATVSGSTTPTLSISSLTLGDASNFYRCVVSGTSPCNLLSSDDAILIVNQNVQIDIQPEATQTVCAGSFANFFLLASGGGLSYQWYKGTTMLVDGGTISGATTSSLTINPIDFSDAGTDYYCVVSNSCNSGLASIQCSLSVNQTPFIPDQTLTVCSEDPFDFSILNGIPTSATVVPLGTTYSWPAPIVTGGLTGGSIGFAKSSVAQTLVNPTNTPQTATYYIVPTSGTSGSCIGTPFALTVTVNPKPEINNISSAFCSDENFSFTPTNGSGNIVPIGTTYSWSAPIVTGGMTGGSAATGQASISQTLSNPTNVDQTASYTVTATSGSCSASTFSVTVTIHPKPTVTGSVLSQNICSPSAITPIVMSNPNGILGAIDYNWTRDNVINATGIATSGTGTTISGTLTNTTNVTQTVNFSLNAVSEDGCVSNPVIASVLVDPKPTVAASPASQTVCSDSPISSISLTNPNSVLGTTYSWTRDNITNLTGIAASGTTSSISGTLTNNTNVPQTTTFTIIATAAGCDSSSTTITITVNPKPTVVALPLSQTLCGSSPFGSIAISNPNNIAGTTFNWTRNNTINVTGLPNSGSGSSISGTLTNNTNSSQTVDFTITAQSGSCISDPDIISITVLPTPLVTVAPTNQTRCHLQAITTLNFSNSNAVAGTTYSWTRDNTTNLTGIPASGSGATLDGSFTNNTTSTQTTIFTITALAPNGCSSSTTASVTVYAPLVAPVINSPQTVCVLSNPSLLTITTPASGGSGLYTYQWQSSNNNVTYNNIAGATNNTYQPPFVNGATANTYYRLITTNICGNVTSNVIFVEVVSSVGFSFGFDDDLTGPICSGSSFTPDINSLHFSTSSVRFNWTADSNYISPASGGPVGTTGGAVFGFRTSSANIGPLTAVNNTNATVVTSVTIVPNVYNFPGPPSGSFICSTSPQTFNVTIRPIPVATATGDNSTICNGTSPNIGVSGNITDATMTFSWTRNNTTNVSGTTNATSGNISFGSTYTINPVLTNNTAVSQIVQFTITPRSNGCNGSPIVISITVAPNVTSGTIAANQTICSGGDPVAFTQLTPATGINLSYQWQSSTDNFVSVINNIPLATGTTYDSGVLTQNTWFRRVVTSTVNGTTCTANSAVVLVTINNINPGSISGNQTICSGANPTILGSVAATGTGSITYQWQSNTSGCGGSFTNIVGATAATYSPPAGLSVTTYYRRIAFSTFSSVSCSDFSNCVEITINDVTAGTVGNDQTLCGNNPSAFTEITPATASGTITYQWQSNTSGCGGSFTNIVGATAATYDPPAGLLVTTYYRRVVTSTLNSVVCSAISNCITVTANSITPGTISGNRTVCNGGDPNGFTTTVAATGLNLTYQWQISTASSAGPWTDIAGATSADYDAPGPVTQTSYFRRVATATVNSTNCSAPSNFVTVFVNSVTAATISGDQSICGSTDDPTAFTISTPASGNGVLSYQWQSSISGCSGPWTNITGATSATYDAPNVSQTTYYHVVVTSTLNSVLCIDISNCVTITSLAKTWTGLTSTDWNVATNWQPNGVPAQTDCVIIPNVVNDPVVIGTNYNATAKTLSLLAGASLEVTSNNAITVNDGVNVNVTANFTIRNNASLVQVSNAINIGKITVERITQPMYRFDYTYWGSPVTLASNFTLGMLSPNTLSDKFFSWIPSVSNGFGNWAFETPATAMNPTKGYIARAPQNFSFTPDVKVPYTANFIGTPNNGDIYCPIYFGALPLSNNNDKYNLLGNPYASAVDAELFLSDPANLPIIDGTIYFWTHNSQPSASHVDPFYGDFIINYAANDYASWNRLGGTGTTAAAGSGGAVPNGYIASGQGFFAKSTGTANNGDPVVFRNSMRVAFNNDQFFRSSIVDANANRSQTIVPEKHRLWLNLVNQGGSFNQILLGYAEAASNGFDRDFDGVKFTDNNSISMYSILQEKNLVIQGRGLPFSAEDQIPLGYKSTVNDTFAIRIDHFDGLFETQNIYIEDRLLNVIHNLKQSPYSFTSSIGTFNDRFVLRYTNAALGNVSQEAATDLIAYLNQEKLFVQSQWMIDEVTIYDIAGKLIFTEKVKVLKSSFERDFYGTDGVYLAKIKLQNGIVLSRKLIQKQ
ncbi:hypothetical protein G4D82_04810 [Flavobacterium sp. CYK-4]|uniref:PKD-like domain-containing protein n=1 Tax=Flavobacterium lotistagni TaxID=2709660 RepID=UPI001407DA06|nr:PKD-like domain-containing protein [Flavobacterium lotistagni]NHM06533.1 hypothetical protein [Flavobacterium lotistagni]